MRAPREPACAEETDVSFSSRRAGPVKRTTPMRVARDNEGRGDSAREISRSLSGALCFSFDLESKTKHQ